MAKPSVQIIIERAALRFDVGPRDIRGKGRLPHVVAARQAAYLAGRMAGYSGRVIGLSIGREPSSVCWGVHAAIRRAATDAEYAQACAIIAKGK